MGGQPSVPEEVKKLPKNDKAVKLVLEYCGAWGGYPEAKYASDVIKTVFPNASTDLISPGVTGNLVIKYEGQSIYDKKGGDGAFRNQKAV